jgi:hypothetical protein
MAARNRKSQIARGLALAQGPVPTSRLGGRSSMARVSRHGESTVAMSAEERRNEDG